MFDDLTDDELFAEVLQRRAGGEAVGAPLGALCERWARPARYVISKIQASYGRGSPADADELYQDAVGKFLDRGLDQFRGVSEQMPGRSASPKTFFLRIVKHVAIDFYRRQREDLAPAASDPDDAMEEPPSELAIGRWSLSRAVRSAPRPRSSTGGPSSACSRSTPRKLVRGSCTTTRTSRTTKNVPGA